MHKLIHAHRHTQKIPNILKRLSGARQAFNLTHTHTFFGRTILLLQPRCPDYRPLEMGISESVGVVLSEYLTGHLNNAVIPAAEQQTLLGL